ncbi:hypothetical protein IX324_002695 [Bacteroides pyogenes]|nr:hypothetical protein [Bacteroides pyogenes]
MKFIDLSKEDRTDVLDRVSTELNIRQREYFVPCSACHTPNTCLSKVVHH